MDKKVFGYTQDNKEIYSYTIKDKDIEAEILNYGCIVRRLLYKGVDVVLGYDAPERYVDRVSYYGCVAGRYANRINKGKFSINNIEYQLNNNNGNNHLHGGFIGLNKRLWDAEATNNSVVLTYMSPDGEECYPGNLELKIEYKLENNSLVINYYGKSDKDTICNLTNHSYFNLNGHNSGDILNHTLTINADYYTPVDDELITTGEITPVENTYYDFKNGKKVGTDISEEFDGYDTNFCLNGEFAAVLEGDKVKMEVYTDKPGVQLFTGNNIQDTGKGNAPYNKYAALCLETQYYPDSINKPNFPSPLLKAGKEYKTYTIYKFLDK